MTDGAALARRWQLAILAIGRSGGTHAAAPTGARLCSDVVLVHAPGVRGVATVGATAIARLAADLREAFAIDTVDVEPPLHADGRIAIRWTLRGVHVGRYLGIEPSGLRVEIDGVDVIRVADDRIAEVWRTYDRLELVRRLRGAEAPPD